MFYHILKKNFFLILFFKIILQKKMYRRKFENVCDKTELWVLPRKYDQCETLILGQLGWEVENFLQDPMNLKDLSKLDCLTA